MATMRSWQNPLLPSRAAMCPMSSPDEYVPCTKTIGLVFWSQSASFTTTGHSPPSGCAGGVPAKPASTLASPPPPASGAALLSSPFPHPISSAEITTAAAATKLLCMISSKKWQGRSLPFEGSHGYSLLSANSVHTRTPRSPRRTLYEEDYSGTPIHERVVGEREESRQAAKPPREGIVREQRQRDVTW